MPEERSDWFIVNATDAPWRATPGWGRFVRFEPDGTRFADYGINVHVLEPGEVSTMYHGENAQEDFLVLSGRCLACSSAPATGRACS
jgi:mannose-6-phosphate isomerase-like protein (cupin superfamily)